MYYEQKTFQSKTVSFDSSLKTWVMCLHPSPMSTECISSVQISMPSSSLSSSFDSVSSTVPVNDKARYHAKRNLKQVKSGRICVWFILFLIIQRCFEVSCYVPSNDKLIMDDEFVENCGSVFSNCIGASARRQWGKLRNKTSSQPLNQN